MNERVARLKERLEKKEAWPICVEKLRLVMESMGGTEGQPLIRRRAEAIAHFLDNRTLFIEDDELIVGNVACKPKGLEYDPFSPPWNPAELEAAKDAGLTISPEDEAIMRSFDDFWAQGRTEFWGRMAQFYDDERIWPFLQTGSCAMPMKKKGDIMFRVAGGGWGAGLGLTLIVPDFAKVLNEGFEKMIADAEEELRNIKYISNDAFKKVDFLHSVIVTCKAMINISQRYGRLAEEMAAKETDPKRKKELEQISENCKYTPAKPARNFREAMQALWFSWLMTAGGTTGGTAPLGRFDQYMYPFYKKDKEEGRITDDEVLELLECLRLKVMQVTFIPGINPDVKDFWAGVARWNNMILGGVTKDGQDASNELSYLVLDAAGDCRTPHHTITLRVHEGTPEPLMMKALDVVKTGIGMPAIVSDESIIGFFTSYGASLEDARDYAISGCLDVQLPGKSRTSAVAMNGVPRVLEWTMSDGVDMMTGFQIGPKTGGFESFDTYEDFEKAFYAQFGNFIGLVVEQHNLTLMAQREYTTDVFQSMLTEDALKVGRDVTDREMPFENGATPCPVGMINTADSLAAIKNLVFEKKKYTKKDLLEALRANWQGHEDMRKAFLAAPKYGNGDPYVDSIAAQLYKYWHDELDKYPSVFGGNFKSTAISITGHGPMGMMTGATPDGRYAHETLADGSMSAAQGKDTSGPTALLRSAMTIDQTQYQATLLNMKIHPSALKTDEDIRKLSMLIRTYFANGGKHVQFNVVNKETLLDSQVHPEKHRDLIVRVAGYSTYFVQLDPNIQGEIIKRTEYTCL